MFFATSGVQHAKREPVRLTVNARAWVDATPDARFEDLRVTDHAPLRIVSVADCEDDPILEELVWRRLNGLALAGSEVSAFLLRASDALAHRLAGHGVPARNTGRDISEEWSVVRTLIGELRAKDASAFYAHGEAAHSRCALAGALASVPVVAHLLDDFSRADAHAVALCGSTVIASTAHAAAQSHAGTLTNIEVIPTPVPTRRGRGERTEDVRGVVGWAGMLRELYHPTRFLRAAAAALRVDPTLRFRMALPPSDRERALHFVPDVLQHRLSFETLSFGEHGFAAGIDVLVQTAARDAHHMLLLESWTHGVATIAIAVGGVAELAGLGSRYALCRPGDERGLIDAIIHATRESRSSRMQPRYDATSIETAGMLVRTVLANAIAGGRLRRETRSYAGSITGYDGSRRVVAPAVMIARSISGARGYPARDRRCSARHRHRDRPCSSVHVAAATDCRAGSR